MLDILVKMLTEGATELMSEEAQAVKNDNTLL